VDGTFYLKCLTGVDDRKPKPLNLKFKVDHPLQTLGVYENKNIQKVYWTDGENQPRLINITKDTLTEKGHERDYTETSFDFAPEMTLKDSIKVKKIVDSSASFGAGVLQYAVTYYNKYGQESNISCVSSLIYTSFQSRAGSTEEKIGNSFLVTVDCPDPKFEYMRVYSIFRSSINETPTCKRVADLPIYSDQVKSVKEDVHSITVQSRDLWIKLTESSGYVAFDDDDYGDLYVERTDANGNEANGYWFDIATYPDLKVNAAGVKGADYDINSTDSHGSQPDWVFISKAYTDAEGNTVRDVRGIEDGTWDDNYILVSYSCTEYGAAESLSITDNGTIGDDIDSQELLYVGGESVKAETIEQKDGTLFLGNINITRPPILTEVKDLISPDDIQGGYAVEWSCLNAASIDLAMEGASYTWGSQLNAKDSRGCCVSTAGFKHGEHYRLGVQFQYSTGKWSEPVYLRDEIERKCPSFDSGEGKLSIPGFSICLPNAVKKALMDLGYVRARGIVVLPSASDRLIVAQGVLNPTVYSVGLKENHAPDIQSSWFFRPWHKMTDYGGVGTYSNNFYVSYGAFVQCEHDKTLYGDRPGVAGYAGVGSTERVVPFSRGTEIQGTPACLTNADVSRIGDSLTLYAGSTSNEDNKYLTTKEQLVTTFAVNQQYLTMHSPEFEFDDSFASLDTVSLHLRKVGLAKFEHTTGYIDIETSTATIGSRSVGFYKKTINTTTNSVTSIADGSGQKFTGNTQMSARRLCAGLFYKDYLVDDISDGFQALDSERGGTVRDKDYYYMVYPWQRSTSLNNDCVRPSGMGTRSAELKRKVISNLLFTDTKYCGFTKKDGTEDDDLTLEGGNSLQLFNQDDA